MASAGSRRKWGSFLSYYILYFIVIFSCYIFYNNIKDTDLPFYLFYAHYAEGHSARTGNSLLHDRRWQGRTALLSSLTSTGPAVARPASTRLSTTVRVLHPASTTSNTLIAYVIYVPCNPLRNYQHHRHHNNPSIGQNK